MEGKAFLGIVPLGADMVLLDEPFQAMDTAQEELARGKISLEAHNGKTFLITIPKIYE